MSYRENPQLLKFVSLFLEKNSHINLSAIRDEEGVWEKHIEDSLITADILKDYLQNRKQKTQNTVEILDLGTG